MNFLYYEVNTQPGDVVEVTLDARANVRLMDFANLTFYQKGRQHHYFGGLATVSPYYVRPPHGGRWYVVVDLGGRAGTVSASVRTVRG